LDAYLVGATAPQGDTCGTPETPSLNQARLQRFFLLHLDAPTETRVTGLRNGYGYRFTVVAEVTLTFIQLNPDQTKVCSPSICIRNPDQTLLTLSPDAASGGKWRQVGQQ
jgi:hypothetical protein